MTKEKKDMDSTESLKSYAIVDVSEEEAFRRKTRKRLIIITISSIVLLIIISVVVGTIGPLFKNSNSSENNPSSDSIKLICNATLYPDSCFSSISSFRRSTSKGSEPDPDEIFLMSLQVAVNELMKLSSLPEMLIFSRIYETTEALAATALRSCKNLIQDAIDHIDMSISSAQIGQNNKAFSSSMINDIRTWLSTAITDQETCLDGLLESGNQSIKLHKLMTAAMSNSNEFTSNSLAIVTNILAILSPMNRKLLEVDQTEVNPESLRQLLQAEEELKAKPNLTVALDGTGDLRTINQALDVIPKKSDAKFVIYVKEGVYLENVNVTKYLWNVMMYGDGMNKTIVSGSLNRVDGMLTFHSGTFIVEGRGFIAKDMGFKNTAGPAKHQAVALRSSSDKSVFHRCSFDAYQATLYTHSNRQFYTDCHITGSIDSIFGNAAVVLQNCQILPRQPMPGQFNTITAQSKSDPNQDTGMSIQMCDIKPLDNLTAKTYLGRPWKNYSMVMIMQSFIEDFVDPAGWTQWNSKTPPPSTLFYAEYRNIGPGSGIEQRVEWVGYRPNATDEEAEKFTVDSLIQGSEWLPATNLTFDKGL